MYRISTFVFCVACILLTACAPDQPDALADRAAKQPLMDTATYCQKTNAWQRKDGIWRQCIRDVPAKIANSADAPRLMADFNRDWTFNYFPQAEHDTEFAQAQYDDGAWPVVSIPHTWSTFETTGDVHPFILSPSERDDPYWWNGWGVYRKTFSVDADHKDKLVRLEFDGVQKYSEIWLNGKRLEGHKGGYTSFYVDLTPHLKFGEKNILTVFVSNKRNDQFRIAPMTAGNWDLYGGIYRDVRLVITDRISIPYQGSYKHEGGVFIKTPEISSSRATLEIDAFVQNRTDSIQIVEVRAGVLNAQGQEIATETQTVSATVQNIHRVTFTSLALENPSLWSPDSPYLYKAIFTVSVDGKVTDIFSSRFGVRQAQWNYEENALYLNGERVRINGTNRHQEFPWLGDAIPHWITYRDMYDIKYGLGHNFMRAAHYPNDPYLYQLADEMGILIVEETPNIKSIDFDEDIQRQNVVEMIRRDRNHPSIIFWSLGNETSDPANPAWARAEDTSRMIHIRKGHNDTGDAEPDHTDVQLDMENLLRVSPRGLFDYGDPVRKAGSNPENGQHAGSEEWQHARAQVPDGSIRGSMDQDVVVWLYNDHGADREYLNAPVKHVNAKGWVDPFRSSKYIYHLWRAAFTDDPVVHVHDHFWRPRFIGTQQSITVDTNCAAVGLFAGAHEVGKKRRPDGIFSVTFEQVQVTDTVLKGVCYPDEVTAQDKELPSDTAVMAGAAYSIALRSSHTRLSANNSDVAVIDADVVDRNGVPVADARHTLQWQVTGPAQLVGPDVFRSDDGLVEAMSGYGYIEFPVSNIIRAGDEAGDITVTVTAEGLKPAHVTLTAEPEAEDPAPIIKTYIRDAGERAAVKRLDGFEQTFTYKPVIQPLRQNETFSVPRTFISAKKQMEDFVRGQNQHVRDHPAFALLTDKLAAYLVRMKGKLIADDYNFEITKFNDVTNLERYFTEKDFHADYVKLLTDFYLRDIMQENRASSFDEIAALYAEMPANHLLVHISPQDGPPRIIRRSNVTHTIHVTAQTLDEALTLVAPFRQNTDIDISEITTTSIRAINPYVTELISVPDGKIRDTVVIAVP